MATANWKAEQPTNLNYLSPINFDFQISKLPKVKYFLTGVTLPSVNFSETTHETTLAIQSYLPGDSVTFDPLLITFLVDEDMTNYQEIYNWIIQLGPGYDTDDFRTLTGATKTTTGFSNRSADFAEMYSDATLIVNTSSNNANVEFMFEDCFPTSLGNIEFTSNADGQEYATCDLTLRYTLFKIKSST
tara:strand:- start:400 stop:963 length:564 start_codon:yes stop_codon:yes gene_type:complete